MEDKIVIDFEEAEKHVPFTVLPKRLFQQGGPGSGNFGHEGRPGLVGGSSSIYNKYFPLNSNETTNAILLSRLELNRLLRGEKLIYENYPDLINVQEVKEAFEYAMNNNAQYVESETIAYRGIRGPFTKKVKVGKTFHDAGYTFLTTDKNMAKKYAKKNGIILQIKLPKGQKFIEGLIDQNELILPTNISFEIIKVNNNIAEAIIK